MEPAAKGIVNRRQPMGKDVISKQKKAGGQPGGRQLCKVRAQAAGLQEKQKAHIE